MFGKSFVKSLQVTYYFEYVLGNNVIKIYTGNFTYYFIHSCLRISAITNIVNY